MFQERKLKQVLGRIISFVLNLPVQDEEMWFVCDPYHFIAGVMLWTFCRLSFVFLSKSKTAVTWFFLNLIIIIFVLYHFAVLTSLSVQYGHKVVLRFWQFISVWKCSHVLIPIAFVFWCNFVLFLLIICLTQCSS